MNPVHAYCQQMGKTVEQMQAEYAGGCIEFAGELMHFAGRGRMAYFLTPRHPLWRYHAAVEIDGLIHDLWHGCIPLEQFIPMIGADGVEYPCEEEDDFGLKTHLDFFV